MSGQKPVASVKVQPAASLIPVVYRPQYPLAIVGDYFPSLKPGSGILSDVSVSRTITYTYDPLNRLTAANYGDGTFFDYTYDAVGNRLTQTTKDGTTAYTYDAANRLSSVGGVSYTWDANGNLLSNGTSVYTYDTANRLASVTTGGTTYQYTYNGNGDRVAQGVGDTTTRFTLNSESGLTQVLSDGTNTYLYGNERIAQQDSASTGYFLGDALGSVRQLVDDTGAVTLSRQYDPFGNVIASDGTGMTIYGFDAEQTDSYIKLMYLRSRYMSTDTGRFITKDAWQGDYTSPTSLNQWVYVEDNPLGFVDPLGMAKKSFLFYFDGAGNTGNDSIGGNQQVFLANLKNAVNGQVDIVPIFPYGTGIGGGSGFIDNIPVIVAAAYGNDAGVTSAKADQIWNYVFFGTQIPDTVQKFKNCPFQGPVKKDDLKINFLGYSGGGQIAYTTAQRLSGRLSVDNLILFGSPWRAYNGTNNIGHIWEVWGKGDLDEWYKDVGANYGGAGYAISEWRDYNRGYRVYGHVAIYDPSLDIYQYSSVKQLVYGNSPDFNHDSYFNVSFVQIEGKVL